MSENRMLINLETLNNNEKLNIFFKILDASEKCEIILGLRKGKLLYFNEKIMKLDLQLKLFIHNLRKNILFCGCNNIYNII